MCRESPELFEAIRGALESVTAPLAAAGKLKDTALFPLFKRVLAQPELGVDCRNSNGTGFGRAPTAQAAVRHEDALTWFSIGFDDTIVYFPIGREGDVRQYYLIPLRKAA